MLWPKTLLINTYKTAAIEFSLKKTKKHVEYLLIIYIVTGGKIN
jgi:hypothetical protein